MGVLRCRSLASRPRRRYLCVSNVQRRNKSRSCLLLLLLDAEDLLLLIILVLNLGQRLLGASFATALLGKGRLGLGVLLGTLTTLLGSRAALLGGGGSLLRSCLLRTRSLALLALQFMEVLAIEKSGQQTLGKAD